MTTANPLTAWDDPGGAEDCCAYLIEDGQTEHCGEPCGRRSSYCPAHHRLTHFDLGSAAEAARIREFRAIARASINGGYFPRGGIIGPIAGELTDLERRSGLLAVVGFRRRAAPATNDS